MLHSTQAQLLQVLAATHAEEDKLANTGLAGKAPYRTGQLISAKDGTPSV